MKTENFKLTEIKTVDTPTSFMGHFVPHSRLEEIRELVEDAINRLKNKDEGTWSNLAIEVSAKMKSSAEIFVLGGMIAMAITTLKKVNGSGRDRGDVIDAIKSVQKDRATLHNLRPRNLDLEIQLTNDLSKPEDLGSQLGVDKSFVDRCAKMAKEAQDASDNVSGSLAYISKHVETPLELALTSQFFGRNIGSQLGDIFGAGSGMGAGLLGAILGHVLTDIDADDIEDEKKSAKSKKVKDTLNELRGKFAKNNKTGGAARPQTDDELN